MESLAEPEPFASCSEEGAVNSKRKLWELLNEDKPPERSDRWAQLFRETLLWLLSVPHGCRCRLPVPAESFFTQNPVNKPAFYKAFNNDKKKKS